MAILDIKWAYFTIPLAIILLAFAAYSVSKLKNNRALAEKYCYYLLIFLLVYKTFHYILYCTALDHTWDQQIPCEISQVSFFLCPIAYLSQNKWLKDPGRFIGFFAGCIQLIAIAVAPGSFANSGTLFVASFIETIIMHYILFWCGLVQMLCIEKIEVKKIWITYIGVLVVVLWGVLASFTWRFGTDIGHPNEPANIAFVQRCVLPTPITDAIPWLNIGHNFIVVYLLAFFGFTAIVYLLSAISWKKQEVKAPSIYGMGWWQMGKFLKTHSVAVGEKIN